MQEKCVLYWYQVLGHVHSDSGHLVIVFTDHFLNDIGQVIILCFFHHVQELLHDWADVGSDVYLSYKQKHTRTLFISGFLKHVTVVLSTLVRGSCSVKCFISQPRHFISSNFRLGVIQDPSHSRIKTSEGVISTSGLMYE